MIKQLIRYHIKQGIWPLATFFLLAIFSYGFSSFSAIENFDTYRLDAKPNLLQTVLVSPIFAGFGALLIAVFAILMVGQERGSGRSLILHALPIHKKHLFFIKLSIGAAVLIIIPILGFFSSWFILQGIGGIHPFDYVTLSDLTYDFFKFFIFDMTVFAIFLFSGTIAGDIIGQLLIGMFLFFLNYFTFFAIAAVTTLGFGLKDDFTSSLDFLMTVTTPFPLLFQSNDLTGPAIYSAALTILLLVISRQLYVRSENERLGRFTVFPKSHPFFIILFTVYTTFILAAVIGVISSENQILYWLAVLILAWPAFSSYRRMIGWSR